MLVVTAANQAAMVSEQLPDVAVLSEPVARNTAPCIGYAALKVLQEVGDVPMLCIPADHMVWGEESLIELYAEAARLAAAESILVTIGIQPSRPETGYGYIERGSGLSGWRGAYHVKRFVEKPSFDTARDYVQSGHYFWNSGMFAWRPSVILAEMAKHLPELRAGLQEIEEASRRPATGDDTYAAVESVYQRLPSVSIDYGIMEKADNVAMLSGVGFQWSDVGSWLAWAEAEQRRAGEKGNITDGDVVLVDTEHCAVVGSRNTGKRKLIAGVGLRDLIIVETDDAILVCHRDSAQDVKQVVDILKERGRKDLL